MDIFDAQGDPGSAFACSRLHQSKLDRTDPAVQSSSANIMVLTTLPTLNHFHHVYLLLLLLLPLLCSSLFVALLEPSCRFRAIAVIVSCRVE